MELSNPKIAAIVLAHTNPSQVLRLCNHLAEDFDVYIHIDQNSPLTPELFTGNPRVQAIKHLRTHWGSPEILFATLKLMTLAEKKSGGYDRHILISGQDVPLKSNDEIRKHFETYPENDFIECQKLLPDHPLVSRVAQFHWKSPKRSKGFIKAARVVVAETLRVAHQFLPKRRSDFDVYFGSSWVDLTGNTVRRVLNLVQSSPKFLTRFKHTLLPEEMFFQIATHYLGIGTCGTGGGNRYIDWETGPEFPRTLRIEDFQMISDSGALFARKVDARIAPELIEALYNRLN